MKTMKVAMYYANDDVRLEDAPRPEAGPGEAVMQVMASGICGSDVMQWYRRHKVPLVLGHEVAGEVVEVGGGVSAVKPGDRVVAAHHVPCNTCRYCLDGHHTVCDTLRTTSFHPGGFSEYLRLPAINVERGVFPMPDNMSYAEGTFVEPLACVLRGQKAAGVSLGKSILVIGSGISGALHIALAHAIGAGLVVSTDINAYRLEMAEKLGADWALKADSDVPSEFRRINDNMGADVVILTAASPAAIEQAFESVDRGGTILFFAPAPEGAEISLPVNRLFWRNEITLTSSYAANREEHMAAMELIRSGRVRVGEMITHRFPLEKAQEGFSLVEGGSESLKVIIEPAEKGPGQDNILRPF
jgi:L-iditol 2-dehydrogenase